MPSKTRILLLHQKGEARLSDSYSSLTTLLLKFSVLLFLATEHLDPKKTNGFLELTLDVNSLSFPWLFREEKIKYTSNSTVTLLDTFCYSKGPHGTYRDTESFSLLENSRDNHIVLFSNAPHYCFDVLYGQSIFINSSIHPKVDFL